MSRSEPGLGRHPQDEAHQTRAELEEQLQHALAAGDRERVSELRLLLADVEAVDRGRRADW